MRKHNAMLTPLVRLAGGSDTRGPYNTQDATTGGNPNWSNLVLGTISGVRRRLPLWLRWGC